MKNKYKNKLLCMALLTSVLIVLIGTVSADITMQGGNVVGQTSDLASGTSSAGADAIAIVEHGTGSTNSNTNIDVNDAAGLAASDASASASTSTGGVVLTATVAWGNLKNTLGGFSYDVSIGSAKPGATAEATSNAGVDLSEDGQSSVTNGANVEALDVEDGTAEVVTTGADTTESAITEVGNSGADTSESAIAEVGNSGDAEVYTGVGNFGIAMEELPSVTDVDYGLAVQ